MAQLSEKCRTFFNTFQESFQKVEELLAAASELDAVFGSINSVVNTGLSTQGFTSLDTAELNQVGSTIQGGVIAGANFANIVAEQTGNARVVDINKIKGATDLLILTNPGSLFTLGRSIMKKLGSRAQAGLDLLTKLNEDIDDYQKAINTVDQKRAEFEERNRALQEEILQLLTTTETDVNNLLAAGALSTPDASVDTVCSDLIKIINLSVPELEFSSIIRALNDIISDIQQIGDVIEGFLADIDRILNYESNFRSSIATGTSASKTGLLLVLAESLSNKIELIETIPPSNGFELTKVARDIHVEFSWLQSLLCKDDTALQSEIDSDPNAGAFGAIVSSLSAIGLTDLEKFRDDITENIRRIRAAVVRTDDNIDELLDEIKVQNQLIFAVFTSVNALVNTFTPQNLTTAMKNIENLLESQGFDRVKSLLENGEFSEYFDVEVDFASSAAALAKCISEEINNFTGFDRIQLERAAIDAKGIERAKAARAQALTSRKSNAIGASTTQTSTVNSLTNTLSRFLPA